MSLVADILLNRPIKLPKGIIRTHNPDERNRHQSVMMIPTATTNRNTTTRDANIERIYNAIADGHNTSAKIEIITELSHATVYWALKHLEEAKRINRIRKREHVFEVKEA